MSPDDRLHTHLERILTGFRLQLDGTLRAASDEIRKVVAAEHERTVAAATADVHRQAQDQLAHFRETARRQSDEIKASAEARIAELRRSLDDVHRSASQQAGAAREQMDAVRSKAATEVEEIRRASDQRVASLVQALRSLDDSGSLSDVLERLLTLARGVADRCALWLADGERLQEWRTSGFDGPVGAAERTMAETVLRDGRPVSRTEEGDRDAAAVPVNVAGTVVAVLYADAPRLRTAGRAWADSLELVTRHASRVLEAATVRQAAAMLAPDALARHSQTVPGHPRPGSVS